MDEKVDIHLLVRRFETSETSVTRSLHLQLNKNLDYATLRKQIASLFEVVEEKEVIKVRNKDNILVPFGDLLKGSTSDNPFLVEIVKIRHTIPSARNTTNLLQDAYLDAIRQKIRSMESRVCQAELLIPQLQWRRQAHVDETVNTLSSRVAFLNRRIDELVPPEWSCKMPETIS